MSDGAAEATAPAPPDPAASAAAAPQRRPNYVARHWRGELSLPVSYWVNGVLAGGIVFVLSLGVQSTVLGLRDPRAVLALAIALIVISLGLPVWQLVGVWRSAGRHKARGGRGFWAVAARVMVVLGVLHLAVVFIREVTPKIPTFYRIAAGDRVMTHEIKLLGDGEAVFSGDIGFGATSDLEAFLDAHPAVTLLHLSSRGGRVLEARRLHDAIRRRGLTTMSTTLCTSACTIAFMGGKERVITPQAKLGFHQATLPDGYTHFDWAAQRDRDARFLVDDGVDRAFAARAEATPNTEIWYPTPDELLSAHVVTRVLPGRAGAQAPAAPVVGPDLGERLGFYGRWMVDCRAPVARPNPVLTLARDGEGARYHMSWGGSPPDFDTRLSGLRQSGERELSYSLAVRDTTLHMMVTFAPGRMRTLQSWNDSGQVMIKDGVITANSKDTPYFQKCD